MKIYYSRSNEVEDEKVLPLITQFINNLPNYGGTPHELTYHKRGSIYKSELVAQADIIIVGTIDSHEHHIPIAKGCFTECLNAFSMGKPVLVIRTGDDDKTFIQKVTSTDFKVKNERTWQIGYGTIYAYTRCISGCYISYINTENEVNSFILRVVPRLESPNGVGITKDEDFYTSLLNKNYSISNQVINSSLDEFDEQYLLL